MKCDVGHEVRLCVRSLRGCFQATERITGRIIMSLVMGSKAEEGGLMLCIKCANADV